MYGAPTRRVTKDEFLTGLSECLTKLDQKILTQTQQVNSSNGVNKSIYQNQLLTLRAEKEKFEETKKKIEEEAPSNDYSNQLKEIQKRTEELTKVTHISAGNTSIGIYSK